MVYVRVGHEDVRELLDVALAQGGNIARVEEESAPLSEKADVQRRVFVGPVHRSMVEGGLHG
jgi:hypothetical protein